MSLLNTVEIKRIFLKLINNGKQYSDDDDSSLSLSDESLVS